MVKKWSSTLLIQLKKQNLIPPLTHWNVAVSIKTNPLIQNWKKWKDNKPWNQGLCEKWSLSNLLDVGTKVTGPNILRTVVYSFFQFSNSYTCRYVLYSINFSVARCRSPMWGSARMTTYTQSKANNLTNSLKAKLWMKNILFDACGFVKETHIIHIVRTVLQ